MLPNAQSLVRLPVVVSANATEDTASKPVAAAATMIPAFFSTVRLLMSGPDTVRSSFFEVCARVGEPAPTEEKSIRRIVVYQLRYHYRVTHSFCVLVTLPIG